MCEPTKLELIIIMYLLFTCKVPIHKPKIVFTLLNQNKLNLIV